MVAVETDISLLLPLDLMVDAAVAVLVLQVDFALEELVVESLIHQLPHQLKDIMVVLVVPVVQTTVEAVAVVLVLLVKLFQVLQQKQVMVVLENNQV